MISFQSGLDLDLDQEAGSEVLKEPLHTPEASSDQIGVARKAEPGGLSAAEAAARLRKVQNKANSFYDTLFDMV